MRGVRVHSDKRILGLDAAELHDIEVPAECRLADPSDPSDPPASPDDAQLVEREVAQA